MLCFGTVQEIKETKKGYLLSVIANNGEYKTFTEKKKCNLYSRVSFQIDEKNGKKSALNILNDREVCGKVIRVFGDGTGLILAKNGEVICFHYEKNHPPEPTQLAQCMVVSPTPNDKKKEYAQAKNVCFIPFSQLTYEIRDRGAQLILNAFPLGKSNVDEIMKVLKESGITPVKYGYNNSRLVFLEAFSKALRVDHNNETITVIDQDECIRYFQFVNKLIKEFGYSNLTVLQERAVFDLKFWTSSYVMIMGATSTGKTMIPIFKFLYERKQNENNNIKDRMLILVPYRALAWQMYQSLSKILVSEELDIVCSTSEIFDRDDDIRNGDVDIAIIIYEKLFNFWSENESIFDFYTYITFDEIGLIKEEIRGVKAELLLLHSILKLNKKITMLATPYFDWGRYISQYGFYAIRCLDRPVKIHEFFYQEFESVLANQSKKNVFRLCDSQKKVVPCGPCFSADETLIRQCIDEYQLGHKTLVFVFSKKLAKEKMIMVFRKIKEVFQWPDLTDYQIDMFKSRFFNQYHVTKEELRGIFEANEEYEALYRGISIHTASLPEIMRRAIEIEYLDVAEIIPDGIKLIFATETLSFGLNSNVDTVIIPNMKKNLPNQNKKEIIDDNLYQNCIGRAGRLGYSLFGISYSFFSDERKKLLKVKNLPFMEYQNDFSDNIDLMHGQIGQMLLNPSWKELSFCILNLFETKSVLSIDQIIEVLRMVPCSYDVNWIKVNNELKIAIKFLIENDMLCVDEKQVFSWDFVLDSDEERYKLTSKGEKLRSFLLFADSFVRIQNVVNEIIETQQLFIADYLYVISGCQELLTSCQNMFINPTENSVLACQDMIAFLQVWDYTSSLFLKRKYISSRLVKEITNNSIMEKARCAVHNNPKEGFVFKIKDYSFLLRVRLMIYAVLRLCGYSLGLITDVAMGFHNNRFDNMSVKFTDKMSHLTDAAVVLSNISFDENADVVTEWLRQISLSLQSGICFDWLYKEQITEITEADTIRQYYIASLYAAKEDFLIENMTQEELNEFYKEYETLDESIKKIINEEHKK